jgi:galactosamine-6-phosphate isomerase
MKIQQLTPGFALHVSSDWDTLCSAAADLTLRELDAEGNLLMCAAAGQSTTKFYHQVHRRYLERPDAFQQLRVVALDEWAGLPRRDPATCHAYLEEHLVAPLSLGPERYMPWRSEAPIPLEETSRMRAWLEAEGPIDLCILGLGINGHLGLNEPGDALIPRAHVAVLTAESQGHAMLAQAATTPALGYTFGVADLLASRRIILLVHGAAKAPALARLLRQEVTTSLPASCLWLHPAVSCFCDQAAFHDAL